MIQNLKGLLDSEIGFDVTFHVGNEFFRAHKCILAARSPVFRAQFFGLVGNPGMETVAIEEFEPFAFKAMLLFLYSDELPEPRELSISDFPCTSTTILQHLLVAADRFDLPRLRLMCEAKLCKEINACTVATTLAIAEQHQCLQMKTICLKFAAKPENLGEYLKIMVLRWPRFWKSKTDHKILSSRTTTEAVKVGGHDWAIHFYPDGNDLANKDYASVFLKLLSPGEVRAAFEFKLVDQSGKGKHIVRNTSITFDEAVTINSWGYSQYMKRSELEISSYLKDDCLSITCTVSVLQTRDVEGKPKHQVIHVPPSDLILAARSPVFRAQFFGSFGNPDIESVTIQEFEPFAFKIMVLRWPRFWKSNTDDKILSSRTTTEAVKGSHEYIIKAYSIARGMGIGKNMSSRTFTVGGHDWAIHFYPDGNDLANKDYAAVFLKLVSPGEVRAAIEFKLVDQSGKGKHNVQNTSITFDEAGTINSWGYSQYMKRSELEISSYLKDDCLSITCTVSVLQTRDEEGKPEHQVIHVPPSDVTQNLKDLLKSEVGCDVTFHVGNEFFRAHKLILAARSPVFRAQFFGSFGNPDIETVTIQEFEPFAFKAMLLFLYSDELPEPRELSVSNSRCTSTTIMHHLLAAADRYDLGRLKLTCEAKLCEEITASTVATTLALAERYQCLQLKTGWFAEIRNWL
ncbi:hypothetical protein MKW92_032784 [Papaver armeniacum]|nr:hypothetical protein MKW92_032784 [Papaver armeniacum]